MHIIPKPMTAADNEAAYLIEKAASQYHWSRKQWLHSLQADYCYGIRLAGEWVAIAVFSIVLEEASLLNVAVLPAHQGKGLGRALLIHGLDEMAGMMKAHQCFLEVRRSNQNAIALYRSLGFAVIGERKNYYPASGGREDALVMMCPLPLEESPRV